MWRGWSGLKSKYEVEEGAGVEKSDAAGRGEDKRELESESQSEGEVVEVVERSRVPLGGSQIKVAFRCG